jgi:tetratricopeptide (TPR) repeat protein
MMPFDQLIIDESRMPPPPHAVSTAGTLWTTLRGFSHTVLVKAQVWVGTGGKILLSGLEIVRKVILAIPWLVACITIAMFAGSWLFAGPSMTVSSFTDPGSAKTGGLGHTIADAVALELQRIDQLDTAKNPWGRAEEVHSLWIATPQAYERVGTINVGGTELPVGELVLALKALLPHWHPRTIISGSIRRAASGESMPVHIVVRLEENGRILKHWSSKEALATDADIERFVRTVAFEIMWSMGKGKGADSPENFQQYIDGVEKFRRYKDTRADQDFRDAEKHLSTAIAENPEYVKAHYYLGTLYNWRAKYQKVNRQLTGEYEQKARETYDVLTAREQPAEAQALGHFGLGLLAYRHYQRKAPVSLERPACTSPSDPHLDMADRHFIAAITLDPTLYFARTGRARIYKERGCIEQAIREFQQARERVQDKSSRSWIDKQIKALQEPHHRARQAIPPGDTVENRRSWLLAGFRGSAAPSGCS